MEACLLKLQTFYCLFLEPVSGKVLITLSWLAILQLLRCFFLLHVSQLMLGETKVSMLTATVASYRSFCRHICKEQKSSTAVPACLRWCLSPALPLCCQGHGREAVSGNQVSLGIYKDQDISVSNLFRVSVFLNISLNTHMHTNILSRNRYFINNINIYYKIYK